VPYAPVSGTSGMVGYGDSDDIPAFLKIEHREREAFENDFSCCCRAWRAGKRELDRSGEGLFKSVGKVCLQTGHQFSIMKDLSQQLKTS